MTDILERPPMQERPPEPGNGTPRPRKRWLGLLIAMLVVGSGLAYGVRAYLLSRFFESTDDAFIEGHVVPISARVAGHVKAVYVTDNEQVQAGKVIALLDDTDFVVKVNQAKAAVAVAEGQRVAAEAAQRAADAQIAQYAADTAAAQADATRAADDLKRYEDLLKSNSVTKQEYDHAKAADDSAKAKLDAAQKKVASYKAQLAQAAASVVAAQSAVEQAKATLQQAELNLSYCKITAPEEGRVTKKNVEAGQYVQVGQPLLALVPPKVWVIANFKETQLAHMKPGQRVEVSIDAFPSLELQGTVDSIQSGTGSRFSLLPPENATGNYVKVVQRVPVKITLNNPPDAKQFQLSPGMSVEPKVRIRD